ncbi:hypothetical protein NDR87_10455 [Nocardia sp. CDC159]|uniref:DUF1109 domain-containing protein n=1 Tax=Nocardia pulmonis TaxID=2951408 RepID=A0A9X2IXI2_9NOCA|nr:MULTISPECIES: hypothetical protein [Nocardia]MCM6773890.1 hypothetical protein [Nocardia pulmonis]MCM6786777.1 hypothetical protein [Nocardia sp. CDC159]
MRPRDGENEVGPGSVKPPRIVVSVTAAIAVGVLLVCYYDRPPFGGDMTDADRLIGMAVGAIGLAVSVAVWAIKSLYVVGRQREWSWWVLGVPAVVVVGLVVGFAVRPADFDSARPDLERIAREMASGGPDRREDLRLGGLEISSAQRGPDGRIYFYDADSTGGPHIRGWVYSPDAAPADTAIRTFEKVAEGWYAFVLTD